MSAPLVDGAAVQVAGSGSEATIESHGVTAQGRPLLGGTRPGRFAAVGSSGTGGGDIARRHKEIIAADLADKTAADF